MSDLISRQVAIDALNEYFARIGRLKRRGLTKGEKAISLDTVGAIKTLPSAEPEIVYCRDCKYRDIDPDEQFSSGCRWYQEERPDDDDYCSYGERKNDG